MSDPNPYTAPDAKLETSVKAEEYEPKVFTFHGRIGRLRFITYFFGAFLLLLLAFIPVIFGTLEELATGILEGVLPEMTLFAGIAVLAFNIAGGTILAMFGKRRLNDLNRSGWFILIYFAPVVFVFPVDFVFIETFTWIGELVSLLLWIYLVYFPGTATANEFGPVPSENSAIVKIFGLMLHVLFAFVVIFGIIALSTFDYQHL